MIPARTIPWHEGNQSHLTAALRQVRLALEKLLPDAEAQESAYVLEWDLAEPAALDTLCASFELSSFERKILLMCAGAEMDARFGGLYSALNGDGRRAQPTFSLALAAFDDAHWSAMAPGRPLRRWHLIDVGHGDTMTTSPLRISGRVLHFLAGVNGIDERLEAIVKPWRPATQLVDSHNDIAAKIAGVWSEAEGRATVPVIELCGRENEAKRNIAAAAAALVGLELHTVSLRNIAATAAELDLFTRLWRREAVLTASALLLEMDDEVSETAASLMESLTGALIVSTVAPRRSTYRPIVVFDVSRPTREEQTEIWTSALGDNATAINGTVDRLVSQFQLGSTAILSAARQALTNHDPADRLTEQLWNACRVQARPRMEGLAQRIETSSEWGDLVLPEAQKRILRQIAMHVRQRNTVYRTWGFAAKSARGLGISAMFAGPSGTGKTMASEALSTELRLDLYRIDLSQVVSKYIGETEKNLGRIFDAAEEGAAILLFDEADALFGKRTEVKDSHDRYANIEVSYLLQRMEAYRGLAILTTNRKSALDQAFLRRIRFVVEFPFPDSTQRAEIWRRMFPKETPTEGLRIEKLARLNASGGNIRNIAINAAFLAADSGEPVRMHHLLAATRSEFTKLETPLTDSEVAGWL
ncbi:MAG TPA: ATP-binding protein [Candidatus Sulfopaludibacter sp.]|nr:ATP-binding protein [Candidatus Sulfopaludibacter sp.]